MEEKTQETQEAQKDRRIGAQFWKARTKSGRDKLFDNPEVLWEACVEYFEWVVDNPLIEEKVFHTNGLITRAEIEKMRAMTVGGLCLFLDIDFSTWHLYKKREDFIKVTKKIEEVIRNQKFCGAAADLLNPNIIARDLGLKEKQDIEFPDENGKPQKIFSFSDTERSARLLFLLEKAEKRAKDNE